MPVNVDVKWMNIEIEFYSGLKNDRNMIGPSNPCAGDSMVY